MALNTDWKEFLNLLASYDVDFIVVGAWARAQFGEQRVTGDIDFWVRTSPENAAKVIAVVEEFGFGSLGLTEADFLGEDQVIELGYPPRRIDLLTKLTALAFETSWNNRVVGDLGERVSSFSPKTISSKTNCPSDAQKILLTLRQSQTLKFDRIRL